MLALAGCVLVAWAAALVAADRVTTPLGVTGVVVALVVALLLRPRLPAGPVLPSLLVALLAVASVLLNRPYATTELLLGRDPAAYGFAATWLVDHPSVDVPLGAGRGAGIGFQVHGDAVTPLWTHAMPALGGLLGRARGADAALEVNLLLGALALVSVFVLGRRLAGDWVGLLVATATAVSLPFVHFTRGMYSEVATTASGVLAVALGLALLSTWSRRTAVATGLALGAAAASRIDGLLPAAVLVPLLALAARVDGRAPGATSARVRLVLLGLVPGLVAGQVDLWTSSRRYMGVQLELFLPVAGAAAVGAVLALLVVAAPVRAGQRLTGLLTGARPAAVLGGAAGLGVVLLLTRPLWDVSRHHENRNPLTESVQAAEGLPLDGWRSYEEQVAPWLAAYLGWPAVLAALVTAVLLLHRALLRREPAAAVVPVVLLVFLAYLSARTSITPDNVWVVRRFLPQVVPLTVVLAGLAVRLLHDEGGAARVVGWVLGGSLVLLPLLATAPVATHVEGRGQREAVARLCAAVGDADVVVAGPTWPSGTLRVHCRATVWEEGSPTPARLAEASDALGRGTVVVTTEPSEVPWRDGDEPPPTVRQQVERLERTLRPPPTSVVREDVVWWVGELGSDGLVDPVPPDDGGDGAVG
ncbi:hypothetical protein [Aquipuribacter hungaricus]|uniref:Glycosyltransferase RgtA/B/C/D-like domain-containing protein n=1 Tax=Aquipuribacter hungaricus TaxID=545624 RepID=A0ABV7WMQ3_9MICO